MKRFGETMISLYLSLDDETGASRLEMNLLKE
jgi:hypothetical protein